MTIDMNKLKGIAAFIDQGIQYNQSSPDMHPEPATQWDHEACIVVGEIRAMVREAESETTATHEEKTYAHSVVGKLIDQMSQLEMLWGLDEPGALVRFADVSNILFVVSKAVQTNEITPVAPAIPQAPDLSSLTRYDEHHAMAGTYMTIKKNGDYVLFEEVEELLAAERASPAPAVVAEAAQQNGGLVRTALIDLMEVEQVALSGEFKQDMTFDFAKQTHYRALFARARAALAIPLVAQAPVTQAVAAERERCARLALQWSNARDPDNGGLALRNYAQALRDGVRVDERDSDYHWSKAAAPSPDLQAGQDARDAAKNETRVTDDWEYCPECGSLETDPPQDGCYGYFCANCGQEWHGDIDYSETVRHNLERLAAMAQKGSK